MAAPYDYYSYTPLVVPERPIALSGFAGARVDRTARVVSILTGLPLFLLDRAVEHRAGCSLGRLVSSAGPRGRHTAEAALLPRALSQHTPPVVALGDMTLLDPGLRWVLRDVQVVYLRQSLDQIVGRLTEDVADERTRHWHLLQGRPPVVEELRAVFDEVTAVLEARADVVCDVEGRHPQRVAQDLIGRLDLDVEV